MARRKSERSQIEETPFFSVNHSMDEDVIRQEIILDNRRYASAMPRLVLDSDDAGSAWWKSFIQGGWPVPTSARREVGILDLFSGAGGLSLGVKLAARSLGIDAHTYAAVDVDDTALRAYHVNHKPDEIIHDSVRNLVSYSVVKDDDGFRFGSSPTVRHSGIAANQDKISVVVGGPPCQGHSTFNNKTRHKDVRNELYLTVPAMAVALDAEVVIIENVPHVRAAKENVVGAAIDLLKSAGYQVTDGVLSANAMGWPQTRSRFFIVATKPWTPTPVGMVEDVLSRKARDLAWLIGDIADRDDETLMTSTPVLSPENQERVRVLHEHEGGVYELPEFVRPQAHIDSPTYKAVYGRLHWDKPAQTITTGFLTPGRGRYVHPSKYRTINPLEAARIQGFPDSYRFENGGEKTTRSMLTKWIGDAVPSPLGFAAGLAAWLLMDK